VNLNNLIILLPFDAKLSDAVEDRLESVVAADVDGGNVVLAGVGFLCSTTSTESSSDSLSDDSWVSVYKVHNIFFKLLIFI